MPNKLTPEQESDLVKKYLEGWTYKQLSQEFGVGKTTARAIVHRYNVPTRVTYGIHNRLLTTEQEDEVIKAYYNGEKSATIASRYGITSENIRQLLIRRNLPRNNSGAPTTYSQSQELKICNEYTGGKSLEELGEKYNLHATSILGMLKRYNIPRRKTKEIVYYCNDHFFDNIDHEYKAYYLGLLWADGNVAKNSPTIQISLQEDDIYLLQQFNNVIENERPLRLKTHNKDKPHHKDQYICMVYSGHMKQVLISYGMIPKKSLVVKFPQVILNSNENIIRHFIRGIFDGDGSVGIYDRNTRITGGFMYTFTIIGTYDVCENIQKLVKLYLNCDMNIRKPVKHSPSNTYTVSINSKSSIIKIMDWLYRDATIYMVRKHHIYLDMLEIQ